jgi:serine/threonine protein kinase
MDALTDTMPSSPKLPRDARLDDSLLRGYTLEKELGKGATSCVYKGVQRSTGKAVAIKVLNKSIAKDNEMIERFKKEAYITSQLFSPYTVWTLDYGLLLDGRPFMVMDFVEGKSANDIVEEEGPMSLARALPIFFQIASGLADAHSHGIMHRDIKPSNVMLVEENGMQDWVKIIDFGIAKSYVGSSADEEEPMSVSSNHLALDLTQSGDVIGSPLYMSPEQCQALQIDHRTDIYSFGCLMYEMLTGCSVFEGRNAHSVMLQHINETPLPLGEKRAEFKLHDSQLRTQMESIIEKALAKNPDDRYQLAADLRLDLRECMNLLPPASAA